ncbi:Dihydroxyacetone kinase 1 [Exophiala dermatitidis]
MQTKHFVNDADKLVAAGLRSLIITRPELRLDAENKIIYAPEPWHGSSRVSIISGGGSGHEPSFTGFVGDGFLSASVAGTVFASPSSRQVLTAIENVDGSKGVLVTVMNYTGDVLNFGVALEKAKARNPGLPIEMLVVGDDVGVPRSRAGKVGRRGIAGTVLVHKVTGAVAAAGFELQDVVRVGRLVADNLASIGVSLSHVHVPGRPRGEATEGSLGADEVEVGMGIHNEAGCARRSGAEAEASSVVAEMLRQLLDTTDSERNFLPKRTSEMVVLVNNLGALSVLELSAVVTEVVDQLQQQYRIKPVRVFAGTFMTSLDGPGFSISLLNNLDTGVNKTLLELLDAPSNVSGWQVPAGEEVSSGKRGAASTTSETTTTGAQQECLLEADLDLAQRRLASGLKAIIAAEPEITKYDDIVGDGDCGTTLKRGAEAVLKSLSTSPPQNIIALLDQVAAAVEDTMDGTSGALYTIFLNSLTHYFKLRAGEKTTVDTTFWSKALESTLAALTKYTPAQVGDRTLMDALLPFAQSLQATGDFKQASQAAKEGAAKTAAMRPGLGRSVYIGNEETWLGKIPDPGAWGLSKFFEGLAL